MVVITRTLRCSVAKAIGQRLAGLLKEGLGEWQETHNWGQGPSNTNSQAYTRHPKRVS